MKKTLPHFPFYPSDFLAKTGRLTDEQIGAYIRLLCEQWIAGDIPIADASADASALRMLCESAERSWGAISKYFDPSDGGMKNPRMEEVRLKAMDIYTKRVNAAESRWSKENAHEDASASATQNSKLKREKKELITESVLDAHDAYKKLSRNKPSPISLEWVTKLCGEHGVGKVLEKIEIMGKKNWLKIEMLEGLLNGETYAKPTNGGIVIMEDPQKEKV